MVSNNTVAAKELKKSSWTNENLSNCRLVAAAFVGHIN
jgi:hypothetical protein